MAATIARATGYDNSRTKVATRLGTRAAEGEANTWRTFALAYVEKDGSGHVTVTRDGKVLHHFDFAPE